MNNDIISRKALKNAFANCTLTKLINSQYDGIIAEIIDNAHAVEALITDEEIKDFAKENFDLGYGMAKVKFSPKHGRWIHSTDEKYYVICSLCSYKSIIWNANFCPNCGADMRGKDNE